MKAFAARSRTLADAEGLGISIGIKLHKIIATLL